MEMEDTSVYTKEQMMEDLDYVLKRLDISYKEWEQIMKAPAKSENDYANSKKMINFFVNVKRKMTLKNNHD